MKDNQMFASLLLTLFVGLKLTNHIDWAWVWVLAPLWAPIAFALLLSLIAFSLAAIFDSNNRITYMLRRFLDSFIKKFRQ